MSLPAGEKLRLILYNMRTGHVEAYEFDLTPAGEDVYRVALPHSLYHRLVAHFGRGPHTTAFTLTHGSFMLHGHLKNNREAKLQVEFEEANRG